MIDFLGGLHSRIWQAVIAGAFIAAGWIVTNALDRRERNRRRAERLRDIHRALFAEIGTHIGALGSDAEIDEVGNWIVARMRDDPDFVPFIPRERNDRVFASITGELHILPRVTIDPIVTYYSQIAAIGAMAQDMRGYTYRSLPQDRRIAIYRDYIAMKKQALAFARLAALLIDLYARDGNDVAEAAARRYRTTARAAVADASPGIDEFRARLEKEGTGSGRR